jgi:hypothetical protein
MRALIAALLALLPLAASAAEEKNCPNGNPVFAEPKSKYAGSSELRFGPANPPANSGTMTLTIGGKVERYYIPFATRTGGPVSVDNEEIWSEIAFFDRSLNESTEDNAAMIYMPDLQVKRTKLLPGSEHIGRVWHFIKCEPAKQSSGAPAR